MIFHADFFSNFLTLFPSKFAGASSGAGSALLRIRLGLLKSVSIGFIPLKTRQARLSNGETGRIIEKAQLLEISVVLFPADSEAKIQKVDGENVLSKKQLAHARQIARLSRDAELAYFEFEYARISEEIANDASQEMI